MPSGAMQLIRSNRLIATVAVMVATAMQAADATIANVALPQLEHDLGGGIELGAWVMASYLSAAAVAAPITGWLRRRFGARRLFPSAVAGFMAASLLCALAPNGAVLIVFRIAQGAAAGVILPLAQAVLLEIYPQDRHGRMLAIWGAVLMLGPVLAPVLGGVITDLISWRGVFAINIPVGLLVIILMRDLRYSEATAHDHRFAAIDVLLLMIGVAALQLCLLRGIGRSWLTSPELITEGSIAVVAVTALTLRAHHSGLTVFRPEIFKDVNFAVAAFYNFMTSGLLFVTVVFVPALGEGPLGYTATLAGFTIVPRALAMMLVMLCVGPMIGRINYRILLSLGWILMAGGLMILSMLPPAQQLPWIILGSTIQAIGAGMLFTPHSTLAFSTLASDLHTDAAGLYSLLRQLGFASGVALMTAVLREIEVADLSRLTPVSGLEPAQLASAATLEAYGQCFGIMAIASLILLPGIFLFRIKRLHGIAKEPV